MKKVIIAMAIILMVPVLTLALDDTLENRSMEADRYLKATPPKELFRDAATQVAMNLPVEKRQGFKDLLLKHLDITALERIMKEAMVKHFTADELKALADFYGSPIGKSAMKKFGVYMAEIGPPVQAEMNKAKAKANREIK